MEQDLDVQSFKQIKEEFYKRQNIIMAKLASSNTGQDYEAETLALQLSNYLDYGQIKGQKFRKNLQYFDVCKTITEIIRVHSKMALDSNNQIVLKLMNITTGMKNEKFSSIIYGDC